MIRTMNEWIAIYKDKDAFWLHDGVPERPHALLSSGQHSDGFFNSELVMEDPMTLHGACRDLVELLALAERPNPIVVDRVVGPAMGAITLAHEVALCIAQLSARPCLRAYTEKKEEGPLKQMVFARTKLRRGELVLPVEDVLTTGGSVERAVDAITDAGGAPLPYIVALVNRSGKEEIDGRRILSLIDRRMNTWEPGSCPLCDGGSKAIRPKTPPENWQLLNAEY